jgi:hypothetical protein
MKTIASVAQKTEAMILPSNGTVYTFFGANSSLPVYYFDSSFISGVK